MSDEETDSDDPESFVKRTPIWRSSQCNQLIQKLEERYQQSRESTNNSKPLKTRKTGPFLEREQPRNAPSWAVEIVDDGRQNDAFILTHSSNEVPTSSDNEQCRTSSSTFTPSTRRINIPTFSTPPSNSSASDSSRPITPYDDEEWSDPELGWISDVVRVRK